MGATRYPTKKHRRRRRNPYGYTRSSPVTIIRPDGTVETRPAYSPQQMQRILSRRRTRSKKRPRPSSLDKQARIIELRNARAAREERRGDRRFGERALRDQEAVKRAREHRRDR